MASTGQRELAAPRVDSSAGLSSIAWVVLLRTHVPASLMPGSRWRLWFGWEPESDEDRHRPRQQPQQGDQVRVPASHP